MLVIFLVIKFGRGIMFKSFFNMRLCILFVDIVFGNGGRYNMFGRRGGGGGGEIGGRWFVGSGGCRRDSGGGSGMVF